MRRKANLCFQAGVRGCKLAPAQEDILAQGFCLAGTKELVAYFGCPMLPDNRIFFPSLLFAAALLCASLSCLVTASSILVHFFCQQPLLGWFSVNRETLTVFTS